MEPQEEFWLRELLDSLSVPPEWESETREERFSRLLAQLKHLSEQGDDEERWETREMSVYGRNSVVRIEQIKGKGPTQEITIQRLLSREHAAEWCFATLEDIVLPDLQKAVKACRTARVPKRIRVALEGVLSDLRKELRECRRKSADPSVGSATRVTVLPEPGPRKAAA